MLVHISELTYRDCEEIAWCASVLCSVDDYYLIKLGDYLVCICPHSAAKLSAPLHIRILGKLGLADYISRVCFCHIEDAKPFIVPPGRIVSFTMVTRHNKRYEGGGIPIVDLTGHPDYKPIHEAIERYMKKAEKALYAAIAPNADLKQAAKEIVDELVEKTRKEA